MMSRPLEAGGRQRVQIHNEMNVHSTDIKTDRLKDTDLIDR